MPYSMIGVLDWSMQMVGSVTVWGLLMGTYLITAPSTVLPGAEDGGRSGRESLGGGARLVAHRKKSLKARRVGIS